MGTEAKVTEMGVNGRSSAAAEKSGEGMALKIFTGAKPSLKADIKPFDITEIRMLIFLTFLYFSIIIVIVYLVKGK
jgi:hypothetical protein